MKKFINVLLSLILALSLLVFTACDENTGNIFEADYKEASVAELATLVNSVDASTNGDEVNFNDGVKLVLNANIMGTTIQMDLKTQKTEDDLLMEGSVLTAATYATYTNEIQGKVYYKGGYLYTDSSSSVKLDDQVISQEFSKTKQAYTLDEYLEVFTELSIIELDIEEMLDQFEETENVKYYVAKTNTKTNVKIEITNFSEDGTTVNGSVVFVFDANYKLIGYMMDATISATYFGETETYNTYMSFEPWSGTVNIPSDLSDYN